MGATGYMALLMWICVGAFALLVLIVAFAATGGSGIRNDIEEKEEFRSE